MGSRVKTMAGHVLSTPTHSSFVLLHVGVANIGIT